MMRRTQSGQSRAGTSNIATCHTSAHDYQMAARPNLVPGLIAGGCRHDEVSHCRRLPRAGQGGLNWAGTSGRSNNLPPMSARLSDGLL
jgi:hypothetical protein